MSIIHLTSSQPSVMPLQQEERLFIEAIRVFISEQQRRQCAMETNQLQTATATTTATAALDTNNATMTATDGYTRNNHHSHIHSRTTITQQDDDNDNDNNEDDVYISKTRRIHSLSRIDTLLPPVPAHLIPVSFTHASTSTNIAAYDIGSICQVAITTTTNAYGHDDILSASSPLSCNTVSSVDVCATAGCTPSAQQQQLQWLRTPVIPVGQTVLTSSLAAAAVNPTTTGAGAGDAIDAVSLFCNCNCNIEPPLSSMSPTSDIININTKENNITADHPSHNHHHHHLDTTSTSAGPADAQQHCQATATTTTAMKDMNLTNNSSSSSSVQHL